MLGYAYAMWSVSVMSVCVGVWVCVKMLYLVEGASCARYRRCPSWLPTLLSWLSLHMCTA